MAPRLEVVLDVAEVVLAVEVEVELAAGVATPELLKVRPRSLRLPRIWGAMMEANFSAWTVPVTRMVRRTSPFTIAVVRVDAAACCFAGSGMVRVFQ